MKRSKLGLSLLCLIMLTSCDPPIAPLKSHYALVCGRKPMDHPIYQVKVPIHWKRKDLNYLDKTDTKLPICEFATGSIRITIHSFPSDHQNDRIAPYLQVERWKKQFDPLDFSKTTSQAFSGYSGILFEGTGLINKEPRTVLGWSMQLANEHYRLMTDPERRADFTIKAVGPVDEMAAKKQEIIGFARSFELIDEIPEQL